MPKSKMYMLKWMVYMDCMNMLMLMQPGSVPVLGCDCWCSLGQLVDMDHNVTVNIRLVVIWMVHMHCHSEGYMDRIRWMVHSDMGRRGGLELQGKLK